MSVKFEGSFFLAGRGADPKKSFIFMGQILSIVGNEYVYVSIWDEQLKKVEKHSLVPMGDIYEWEFYGSANLLRSAVGLRQIPPIIV